MIDKGSFATLPEGVMLQKNQKKLFIPLLDNGAGEAKMVSVLSLFAALPGLNVFMTGASDSHASRGMNKVAADFLDSDCEEWINIDLDISFTPNHLRRLLEWDHPLVYGIYPKKEEVTSPCLCTWEDGARQQPDGTIWVKRSARGFMRVHRSVLEAMKEENGGPAVRFHNHGRIEWDFFGAYPILSGGVDNEGFPLREWLSDDWRFCDMAWQVGIKTLVDPRIVLGHEGRKLFTFSDVQAPGLGGEWEKIPGWFTREDAECYRIIVESLPKEGGRFAEIGCWMGRSLSCFAQLCKQLGKSPEVVAVDTFKGTPGDDEQSAWLQQTTREDLIQTFFKNVKPSLNGNLHLYDGDSLSASIDYDDYLFDAVFIDANHDEEAVASDLDQWKYVVREGGIIAGHDISWPGVKAAVESHFGTNYQTIGDCWLVKL